MMERLDGLNGQRLLLQEKLEPSHLALALRSPPDRRRRSAHCRDNPLDLVKSVITRLLPISGLPHRLSQGRERRGRLRD